MATNYLCMSCDKIAPADDTMIHNDQILCTFCAIVEGAYYGKAEEHLPDEYYAELRKREEDNGTSQS